MSAILPWDDRDDIWVMDSGWPKEASVRWGPDSYAKEQFSGERTCLDTPNVSANLRCRSETCCTLFAENIGCKKVAKNRHLGTIAQLCRAISLQLRHISTIGKKLVKQQYILHVVSQYGELRPTSGWDRSSSLGHPCKFQRVSRLGSVTARHCRD